MLIAFIGFGWWQGCQTRKSLFYTQHALKMADSVNKIGLRAYIGIMQPQRAIIKSDYLGWSVFTKNTGKTPGKIFHTTGRFWIGKYGLDSVASSLQKIDSPYIKKIMLCNEVMDSISPKTNPRFTQQTIRNIYSGTDTLYILTYIKYADIFADTHFTMQCYFTEIGLGTGSGLIFTRYKDYNDGD